MELILFIILFVVIFSVILPIVIPVIIFIFVVVLVLRILSYIRIYRAGGEQRTYTQSGKSTTQETQDTDRQQSQRSSNPNIIDVEYTEKEVKDEE